MRFTIENTGADRLILAEENSSKCRYNANGNTVGHAHMQQETQFRNNVIHKQTTIHNPPVSVQIGKLFMLQMVTNFTYTFSLCELSSKSVLAMYHLHSDLY